MCLNDNGAIQGLDAREDGVYITYVPAAGADAVTKKLGNLSSAPKSYIIDYSNGNGTGATLAPSFSGFKVGRQYFFVAACSSITIACDWYAQIAAGQSGVRFGVFTATATTLSPFYSAAYIGMAIKVFEL